MCALKTCPRDLMTPYCQLIELTQLSDFYLLFSVIISFTNYVSNTTLIFFIPNYLYFKNFYVSHSLYCHTLNGSR